MGGITTDLRAGLAFCTRLPVTAPADARLADAAWTFPIAGAVVGLIGGVVLYVALALNLPPFVTATLAVAATALATGCLHEDGLADTADGFGGGHERARVLEILRDSRIGTYGVIALIVSFLLRVGALSSLAAAGAGPAILALIAAHAGARGRCRFSCGPFRGPGRTDCRRARASPARTWRPAPSPSALS